MNTFNQANAINLLVARLQERQVRSAQLPCEQLSFYAPSTAAGDTTGMHAPTTFPRVAGDSSRGVRIFDMS